MAGAGGARLGSDELVAAAAAAASAECDAMAVREELQELNRWLEAEHQQCACPHSFVAVRRAGWAS